MVQNEKKNNKSSTFAFEQIISLIETKLYFPPADVYGLQRPSRLE